MYKCHKQEMFLISMKLQATDTMICLIKTTKHPVSDHLVGCLPIAFGMKQHSLKQEVLFRIHIIILLIKAYGSEFYGIKLKKSTFVNYCWTEVVQKILSTLIPLYY